MIPQLATAAKAAGLTYRLLSTTVLIAYLAVGVYTSVRDRNR